MGLLGAALVVLGVLGGLALGYGLPLRYGGRWPGFVHGVALGSLVTLLGSVMAGHLLAGWGEELAGTALGVPAGLFVGCFLGAAFLNSIAGGMGSILVAAWRTLSSR